MTEQQKKFIEENINLIEDKDWEKFFKGAPRGIGGVLYNAGIYFLDEIDYIPLSAFAGSDIKTIYIPPNITSITMSAFTHCTNLTDMEICEGVESIDRNAVSDCERLKSVKIPASTKYIGDWAFGGCTSVTDIKIAENSNLESIGREAFIRCNSLVNINIPNGVTYMGKSVFANCYELKSINIPDGLTNIDDGAFWSCGKLTSIEIPAGVTRIGQHAFYGCYGLESVKIPLSVTTVENGAFERCGNINISYSGTTNEWKNLIIKNSKVFKYTTYICNCTDGVVKKSQ